MEMLETFLEGVRSACAAFPDQRRGDVTYSMADIGLSAFSLFFMQSESFLAHQRALEEGRKMSNCQSLFGVARDSLQPRTLRVNAVWVTANSWFP